MPAATPTILISPRGLASLAEWRELWNSRDLAWFLVRRDLKTRYSQSILGLGWAIIQPIFTTGVLTLIFGKLVGAPSDGVPYPIWSLAAVVLWTYFQSASSEVGNCLAANMGVITKVYFPRLILPLAGTACRIFDLFIMLGLLVLAVASGHSALLAADVHIQVAALWAIPLALLITTIAALALGLWLAALSVQYRDVRVGQGLLLQLLMYASPIMYSSTSEHIHGIWRTLYFMNPLAGAIETMRAALFHHIVTGPKDLQVSLQISYPHLAMGAAISIIGLIGGIWCFRRAENLVADVA